MREWERAKESKTERKRAKESKREKELKVIKVRKRAEYYSSRKNKLR